jgi:hypothetical protein
MNDRSTGLRPREDAGVATAEDGVVILEGPDGVAVTMTADAAARTADSLQAAAAQARTHLLNAQTSGSPGALPRVRPS